MPYSAPFVPPLCGGCYGYMLFSLPRLPLIEVNTIRTPRKIFHFQIILKNGHFCDHFEWKKLDQIEVEPGVFFLPILRHFSVGIAAIPHPNYPEILTSTILHYSPIITTPLPLFYLSNPLFHIKSPHQLTTAQTIIIFVTILLYFLHY